MDGPKREEEIEVPQALAALACLHGLAEWDNEHKCLRSTKLGNKVIIDYCEKALKEEFGNGESE